MPADLLQMAKIDIGNGQKVPIGTLVETYKRSIEVKEPEPVAEAELSEESVHSDEIVYDGWNTYGATTFADLNTARELQERSHQLDLRTRQYQTLVGNVMWNAMIEDKVGALRALTDEFIGLIQNEIAESGAMEPDALPYAMEGTHSTEGDLKECALVESASGSIVRILEEEVAQETSRRDPVKMDMVIIRPGWGNTKDNNFYTSDALAEAHISSRFVGAKMHSALNHNPATKGSGTEVGKIRETSIAQGIPDVPDGSLLGHVVIWDASFAENARNRQKENELHTLECSIYGKGMTRKGTVDGKAGHIVESIDFIDTVDFVTRAGAGGHALNLLESQEDSMEDQKPNPTEVPVSEEQPESDAALTTLREGELAEVTPETAASQPAGEASAGAQETPVTEAMPELLAESAVMALIGNKLPKEAAEWLAEGEYLTEAQVQAAITKAQARVKSMNGSGATFGVGASQVETQAVVMSEEAYQSRLDEIDKRHGLI